MKVYREDLTLNLMLPHVVLIDARSLVCTNVRRTLVDA